MSEFFVWNADPIFENLMEIGLFSMVELRYVHLC